MKFKKDQVYYIEWLDHCTCYYSWTHPDNIETSDYMCSTAGFFIKESKTSIFIGLNKSIDGKYSNVMQIIKGTIVKSRLLK